MGGGISAADGLVMSKTEKEKSEPGINQKGRFAFVIPVYNHAGSVAQVIQEALSLNFPVFVVDDGSTDTTYEQIKEIAGIQILRHQQNQGKGAAIMTGFAAAATVADWAITIDADGQHYPEDALKLMAAIPKGMRPIVCGSKRRHGR